MFAPQETEKKLRKTTLSSFRLECKKYPPLSYKTKLFHQHPDQNHFNITSHNILELKKKLNKYSLKHFMYKDSICHFGFFFSK